MAKLELERRLDATSERVWPYLATAAGLACWQADEVTGGIESGEFSFRWTTLGVRLDLSVRDLVRGERLVLAAGQNQVTTHVEVASPGSSVVRLVHEGIDEEDLDGLACSWALALATLEVALETEAKHRLVSWHFEAIEFTPELAHHYMTDPGALSSWLGVTEQPFAEGQPFALAIDGELHRGRVLVAVPGRDVALAVDAPERALLVLRTLAGPEGKRVLCASVSSFDEAPPGRITGVLDDALARLSRSLTGRGQS